MGLAVCVSRWMCGTGGGEGAGGCAVSDRDHPHSPHSPLNLSEPLAAWTQSSITVMWIILMPSNSFSEGYLS